MSVTEMIGELQYKVIHLLPYNSDNQPSYCFVVLYKMIEEKLNYKQLKEIMQLDENCKCLGLLYMRFQMNQQHLLQYLSVYLYQKSMIQVGYSKDTLISIGEYTENLLMQMDYYTTRLNRINVKHEKEIKLYMQEILSKRLRYDLNQNNLQKGMKITLHQSNTDHSLTLKKALVEQVVNNLRVRVKFHNPLERLNTLDQHYNSHSTHQLYDLELPIQDISQGWPKDIQKDKQRENERDKDLDKQNEKEKDFDKQKDTDTDRPKDRARDKDKDMDKQIDKNRDRPRYRERPRDTDRNRERGRGKYNERARSDKERDKNRSRSRDKYKN